MAKKADKTPRQSLEEVVKGKPQSLVEEWTAQFAAYDRQFAKWQKRVTELLKKYRDEDRPSKQGNARFNVLWANVQTLIPATFARIPKADVSRRFHDPDPVGRVGSLLLERSLEFEMEQYTDFADTMKAAVLDRFLGGRGTAWARYEPHMRAQQQPTDGVQVTDKQDEPQEELDYECAPVDYVHWRDFGHTVARTWDEVTAVWRVAYMRRPALVERFGEELGNKISLDATPEDLKRGESNTEADQAAVYEIWDKTTKRAIWISKAMPEPLDVRDDPLGLQDFFPCPRPLYATLTNESLIPVPDYALYQDQARELDTLAERIEGLIQMLQVKGVYDGALGTLVARIFTEGTNGTLIPVENWAAFAEKNGLAGAVDVMDIKPIYEALSEAYEAVQQVLKQIYDLTGLSDIVRGQSEASETATAQRIKGQYASLRLKAMQAEVARFATQVIQLKAQIICGKFAPQTILAESAAAQLSQTDQQAIPQALELLLGPRATDPEADAGPNPMRIFRIEVNSDSMVQIDEQEEKENRVEFIKANGEFMEKALPVIQSAPQAAPLIGILWKFGVQAFKVGKAIEGEFDTVIDKLTQLAAQPQQQKPDPEMARVQAQQQADQARLQADQQAKAADMQFEQQRIQMEQQAKEREMQFQAQMEDQKRQHEAALAAAQGERDAALKRYQIDRDNETKIQVAEIAAQATIDAGQIKAAQAAEENDTAELTDTGGQAATAAKKTKKRVSAIDRIGEMHKQNQETTQALMQKHDQTISAVQKLAEAVTKPRMAIRGPDGRIVGLH